MNVMMERILKYGCIFIILMFCLAPICAHDLSLDDNNKYDSQNMNNGTIALDDVNPVNSTNGTLSSPTSLRLHVENTKQGNFVKIEVFMDEDVPGAYVRVDNKNGWGGSHFIQLNNGYGCVWTDKMSQYTGTYLATATAFDADGHYMCDDTGNILYDSTEYTIYS